MNFKEFGKILECYPFLEGNFKVKIFLYWTALIGIFLFIIFLVI